MVSVHLQREAPPQQEIAPSREEEWLWGWDPTPGIVSVWADAAGVATIWRRIASTGQLVRETERFRSWILLDRLDDLRHLGAQLVHDGVESSLAGNLGRDGAGSSLTSSRGRDGAGSSLTSNRGRDGAGPTVASFRELDGPGALRFLVSTDNWTALTTALLRGASARLGRRIGHLRELGPECALVLPPEEQYLVSTGRTYFRDLTFDQLHRLQFDLETTGLDPQRHRIFMVAVRDHSGATEVLEAAGDGDAAEADLITRLVATIASADPDVIENHNLHGFDLPFLDVRARHLGVPLALGRTGPPGFQQRGARRGMVSRTDASRRVRLIVPGRELIDTLDAVLRHDFSARDLPGHGLKVVARHFGIAASDRELIPGAEIYDVYRRDPERVRRYATSDVEEVAGLARILGGAAFALARMAPRRYERLADAGAATGVIDPLLVRAYLRSGQALPVHEAGRDTPHSGAALHLFACGVAHRVVKADVASLYPSLMRAYRIGPARDHLGVLLALVDRLVMRRLEAKASARAAPAGSAQRFTHEAMSAAMKLVVNSAYGYLAAGGGLTRFADVEAANEVTRRGRELLGFMCGALAERGVTLLEADTDGVYFAVPESWSEADERRVVAEVAALLPPLVQLEFEGRYHAMLSHEPKNYVLMHYDGSLLLRGVAFRSSRAEPFAEMFLRRAIERLLAGNVAGVREVFVDTVQRLRRRLFSTYDVSSRVRLTKSAARYAALRQSRRELTYEAMMASGRTSWSVGDLVRVYRTFRGYGGVVDEASDAPDLRDYDVDHYVRVLREMYAVRLARAFSAEDFRSVFADPGQPSLFPSGLATISSVLTPLPSGVAS